MAARESARLSLQERRAQGGQARERAPLSGHSGSRPAADRPDPVALLEAQNLTREPDLVPIRDGRMMVSPFTFYRDPVAIAEYLGGTDAFDQAVTGFSLAYADQNERDLEDFIKAIRSGRLEAVEGV